MATEVAAPPILPLPTPSSRHRSTALIAVACVAVATLSLLLPAAITFDAWGWLVWGREVAHLDLDTTGGPSWKPLPVLVTTLLSGLGDLAPPLWLVVARASGLLAFVAAYRLASRFAGWVAGACTIAFLVLTPDGGSRLLRVLAEGHTAPMEAALWLWAIDRLLERRYSQALWLGVALALLRPEAWPFLAVLAGWLWWRQPPLRRHVVLAGGLTAVLWFGADWWGSGNPWHGADAAQVSSVDGPRRLGLALRRVGRMVVVPAWIGAAIAMVSAWRRRERALLVLGGAVLGWSAVVVLMAVGMSYAALSRFLVPPAALLCVLAGIGVARVVVAARTRVARAGVAMLLVLVIAPFAWPRVQAFDAVVSEIRERDHLEDDVDVAIARAGGPAAVRSCTNVAVDRSDIAVAIQAALAWKLDVPLHQVTGSLGGQPGIELALAGSPRDRELATDPVARPLARTSGWAVYAVRCIPDIDS